MGLPEGSVKLSCEYAITSVEVTSGEITEVLALEPSRHFAKGDQVIPKNPARSTIVRFHHLWALHTEPQIGDALELPNAHVRQLRVLLEPRIAAIELIRRRRVRTNFQVWIEANGWGIDVLFGSADLAFIARVSEGFQITEVPFIERKG